MFLDATNPKNYDCPGVQTLRAAAEANAHNNMFALLGVGAAALVATLIFVRRKRNDEGRAMRSFVLTLSVYVLGAGAYLLFNDEFIKIAHYPAAVGMFACIVGVALINAQRRRDASTAVAFVARRDSYTVVAVLMGLVLLIGVPLIALDKLNVIHTFDATVFWVEAILIFLFAIFGSFRPGTSGGLITKTHESTFNSKEPLRTRQKTNSWSNHNRGKVIAELAMPPRRRTWHSSRNLSSAFHEVLQEEATRGFPGHGRGPDSCSR